MNAELDVHLTNEGRLFCSLCGGIVTASVLPDPAAHSRWHAEQLMAFGWGRTLSAEPVALADPPGSRDREEHTDA